MEQLTRAQAQAEIRNLDMKRKWSRRKHSVHRARERYGLNLNWLDLCVLEMKVASHQFCQEDEHGLPAPPEWMPNTRRVACRVQLYGRKVHLLYDSKHQEIVTILPP